MDIEGSTHERKGNSPLPHDEIISICISNSSWYDDAGEGVCYCICTLGKCDKINRAGAREEAHHRKGGELVEGV